MGSGCWALPAPPPPPPSRLPQPQPQQQQQHRRAGGCWVHNNIIRYRDSGSWPLLRRVTLQDWDCWPRPAPRPPPPPQPQQQLQHQPQQQQSQLHDVGGSLEAVSFAENYIIIRIRFYFSTFHYCDAFQII